MASVVARLFQTVVDQNRSRPPLDCHDFLIARNKLPTPYWVSNDSIREYVKSCHDVFMQIVEDVEKRIIPMPEDTAMANAITLYREAVRYDQK